MILVGSARAGGAGLASHLMNTADNEHIEIHELRDFVSDDLHGAFKEAQAISRATKCEKYLFSLSLNPPQNEDVPIAVFEDAIERIEQRLGLSDLPRAIVFHEKLGRRHAHAVWSRIDGESLTARKLPYFKMRLQDVSRELFLENDWQMPQGLLSRALSNPLNFSLAEWQQAKRSGQDPRLVKAALQRCWQISDSALALKAALQDYGFILARGDRRGHVVIDSSGEVYSLARASGVKAREIRARIGHGDTLPVARDVLSVLSSKLERKVDEHIASAKDTFTGGSKRLLAQKTAMIAGHRDERLAFSQSQKVRATKEAQARAAKLPKGLRAVWSFLSGRGRTIKAENEADAARCEQRDRSERDGLIAKQLAARRLLEQRLHHMRADQARLLLDLRSERKRLRQIQSERHEPKHRQTRKRSL